MKPLATLNWITDEQYLLPTLLSIRSLLLCDATAGLELRVHYTGDGPLNAVTETIAQEFAGRVFVSAPASELPGFLTRPICRHTVNRLTRIAIMRASDDHLSALIDSDVFFAAPLGGLLASLPLEGAYLAGVEEFRDIRKSHLYTRPLGYQLHDCSGYEANAIVAQELRQHAIETQLPQLNNGLLIFRNGSSLAEHWWRHYEVVLNDVRRNPEDDQVPLALATATSRTQLVRLPKRFNSLGVLNGKYAAYHAWVGSWHEELLASLPPSPVPSSDCGAILVRACTNLEGTRKDDLLNAYVAMARPWRYCHIEGYFPTVSSYRSIVARNEYKRFAELGCACNGRSTMFLAESIQLRPDRHQCSLLLCSQGFSMDETTDIKASLHQAPTTVDWIDSIDTLQAQSLDAIFLDTERYLSSIAQVLETVVTLLRSGGLCIGSDLSGKPYEREFHTFTRRFCESRSLALSFGRSRFIMGLNEKTVQQCI